MILGRIGRRIGIIRGDTTHLFDSWAADAKSIPHVFNTFEPDLGSRVRSRRPGGRRGTEESAEFLRGGEDAGFSACVFLFWGKRDSTTEAQRTNGMIWKSRSQSSI